jgi:hypothetical protein
MFVGRMESFIMLKLVVCIVTTFIKRDKLVFYVPTSISYSFAEIGSSKIATLRRS